LPSFSTSSLVCLSTPPSTVLPDSSAPDKGTRVKVAGVVIQEEGGHTDPTTTYAEFLSLEGAQHQVLWAGSPSNNTHSLH
jgi:hypothetical protein